MTNMLYVVVLLTFVIQLNGKQYLRVVQGRDALPGEYPYVLSIQLEVVKPSSTVRLSICTGSLITSTWVLTATHCLAESKQLWVRYGDHTIPWHKALDFYRKVIQQVTHPACILDSGRLGFQSDIALMQIEKIPVHPLGRLSAAEYKSFIGLPVIYAGYGMTSITEESENELKPLQVGDGGVVPCDKEISSTIGALCVAPKCNKLDEHIYKGDSGGPLFYNDQIIGVNTVIYTNDVIERSPFSEHCPVSPYLDWIHNVINQGN